VPLLWREEMALDDGVIDADHKCLIALANDVELVQPGVGARADLEVIVARLARYAEVHFDREERLQAASGFLYAQAHRMNHRAQQRSIVSLLSACRETPVDRLPEFQERLASVLFDWLREHIIKADLMMKPFLAASWMRQPVFEALPDAVSSNADGAGHAVPFRQLPLPSDAGRIGQWRARGGQWDA
jgi:hemerythrin